jgi:hypothetical protein
MLERMVDIGRRYLDFETDAIVGEFGDLGLHQREDGPSGAVL